MINLRVFLFAYMLAFQTAASAEEQWFIQPFTQTLSGGPVFGQTAQSGAGLHHLCGTKEGYLFLASNQQIHQVSPNNERWPIAGDGIEGLIDGDAHRARFRMGISAYYGSHNIACVDKETLFIADTGNRRIRKLWLNNGNWEVSTIAGGGKKKQGILNKGDRLESNQVALGNTFSIAVDANSRLSVATRFGSWWIEKPYTTATWLGSWPSSTRQPGKEIAQLNIMMGDSDHQGNSYFVSRTPDVVVKIANDGSISHFAGIPAKHPKPHHIGDGPPREAYFDTPNSLVASPDGSAVYVCGGDEYDIRRIPTAKGESTQTLMQNGYWGHSEKHPNKARGAAAVTPQKIGKLKPQGKLRVMMVSPLYGRDWSGNLYGGIVPWIGMTQYVEGNGLTPTRVFKLTRDRP